ncbi:MAG: glycosyltransferase family 39 protein [Chloroflexota bacterium]
MTITQRQTRLHLASATLILLAIFFLWSTRLAFPFIGSHDNHTVSILLSARNYLHYGYWELGLTQFLDVQMQAAQPYNLYHHHPPFITLWVSWFMPLFGESETALRMIVILPSMLTAAAVFQLGKRLFHSKVALIAMLFFVSSPVIAFYGQMVAHEQFIMLFFMLALISYHRLLTRITTLDLVLVGLFSGLTVMSGWGGYLCVGTLGLHSLFFRRDIRLWGAVIVGSALASLVWIVPAILFDSAFLPILADRFVERTGQSYTPWDNTLDYLVRLTWARIRPGYTESLLVLTGIGSLLLLWRIYTNHDGRRATDSFALMLLLPHIIYILLLKESAWRHDYTVYYLSFGVAIISAFVTVTLWEQLSRKASQRWVWGSLLVIFLLAHTASSVRWTYTLYTRTDDLTLAIGDYVRENAPPNATIYADFGWTPALWYYAEHDFYPPASYNASEHTAENPAMRLDCVNDDTLPSPDIIAAGWACDVTISPPDDTSYRMNDQNDEEMPAS